MTVSKLNCTRKLMLDGTNETTITYSFIRHPVIVTIPIDTVISSIEVRVIILGTFFNLSRILLCNVHGPKRVLFTCVDIEIAKVLLAALFGSSMDCAQKWYKRQK